MTKGHKFRKICKVLKGRFPGIVLKGEGIMCKSVIIYGYLLLSIASAASAAKITYVDATHGEKGNTKLATGEVFNPASDNSGMDNLWRLRTQLANPAGSGTVYEAGGTYSDPPTANTEDCPRLVTTIGDLPEGTYKVYVYFWSDNSNWRIRADLKGKDAQLPLFYSRPLAEETAPIGAPSAALAKAEDFEAVPLLSEGDRTLWQAYLGTVKGTTITVFVDDAAAHGAHNCRTWYDGIGYQVETK